MMQKKALFRKKPAMAQLVFPSPIPACAGCRLNRACFLTYEWLIFLRKKQSRRERLGFLPGADGGVNQEINNG